MGGTLIYYYYMLSRCDKDDVVVVTREEQDSFGFNNSASYRVVRTSFLPYSRISRLKKNIYYILLFPLFIRWIVEYKPAILHLGSLGYIIPGWLAAKASRRSIMVTVHGEDLTTTDFQLNSQNNRWLLSIRRRIEIALLRKIDLVQANSTFAEDILIKRGVLKKKIFVMTPGVDVDKITCVPHIASEIGDRLAQKPFLLTVGRLVPRKGQDMVLRAMPEIIKHYPDIHYVIAAGYAGEDELKVYRALIETLQLENNVSIYSSLDNQAIAWLYQKCKIFVMPNRTLPDGDTEGYGIVFIEAGAWKKPVIGGRAGGVVDAVDDGVTGFLVDGTDKSDIVRAILELLSDDQLSCQMGEAGRRKAKCNSWETKSAEYLRIITLLSESGPAFARRKESASEMR